MLSQQKLVWKDKFDNLTTASQMHGTTQKVQLLGSGLSSLHVS